MQTLSMRNAVGTFFATVALMAIGFAATLTPANAQIGTTSTSSDKSVGSIRGGVMFLQNSAVNGLVGTTYEGGASLTIYQHPMQDRTSVGVDYITGSRDGNTVRVVPIMVEFMQYNGQHGATHPYVTYGAGIAMGYIKNPSSSNDELQAGHTSNVMAFMGGYGIDYHSRLFIEARYLYAGSVLGDDISGLQLLAGIRL